MICYCIYFDVNDPIRSVRYTVIQTCQFSGELSRFLKTYYSRLLTLLTYFFVSQISKRFIVYLHPVSLPILSFVILIPLIWFDKEFIIREAYR